MSTPRVDAARAYATQLKAQGLRTYVDPAAAAANLPCVLILPPAVTFDRLGAAGAPSVDWRLAVLAEGPAGLECWEELDELLELLAELVDVTTATPAAYTLAGGKDPLPAYLCTAAD